ncbi:MAG: transcriptional regulator with XRE-family HTH domain [Ulvibacter sp.]|jgi:transcriptional regulator with XRE-family HTH domain
MRNIEVNVKKLKHTIRKNSLTSLSLARSIGISPHDLYNSYKGNGVKYEKLALIAKKLNKSIDYFLDDDTSYTKKTVNKPESTDRPYNPELYRTILDLIESTLASKKIEITSEKIKLLHGRIYNIAIDHDNISRDFLDGVVKSTAEYYL